VISNVPAALFHSLKTKGIVYVYAVLNAVPEVSPAIIAYNNIYTN